MGRQLITYDRAKQEIIYPPLIIESDEIQVNRESKEIEMPRFDGVMARDIVHYLLDKVALGHSADVYLFGKTEQEKYNRETGYERVEMDDCGKFRKLQDFFFLPKEFPIDRIIKNWYPTPEELSSCMDLWIERDGWGDDHPPITNLRISKVRECTYRMDAVTLHNQRFPPPGDKRWYGLGKINLDKLTAEIHKHEREREKQEKKTITYLLKKIRTYELRTGERYLLPS